MRRDGPAELVARLEKTSVSYPLWIGTLLLLSVAAIRPLRARSPGVRYAAAPLLGLIVLDLFTFGVDYNPVIEGEEHFPVSQTIQYMRQEAGSHRVAAAGRALPPNIFTYYGLRDIRGYDAIEPRAYMEAAVHLFGMARSGPPNFKFYSHPDYTHPFADFLGLKLLLTERPLSSLAPGQPGAERFRLVSHPRDDVYVYENTRVLPGFYLATELEVEPSPQGRLERLANWGSESGIAIVEQGQARRFSSGSRVRKTVADERSIGFEGEIQEESFLVVAQTYLPGWRCLVNGQPQQVIRTNHAFLGVLLPPGSTDIRFIYEDEGLKTGSYISIAAGLALIVWAIWISRCGNGRPGLPRKRNSKAKMEGRRQAAPLQGSLSSGRSE